MTLRKRLFAKSCGLALIATLISCDGAYLAAPELTEEELAAQLAYETTESLYLEDDIDEETESPEHVELIQGAALPQMRSAVHVAHSNATSGAFSDLMIWPLYAIHAALLPSGKVITYGSYPSIGSDGKPIPEASLGLRYDIWDPARGASISAHQDQDVETGANIFCSAQTLLNSGELLITGGDAYQSGAGIKGDGQSHGLLYSNNGIRNVNSMIYRRWYPTVVPLDNGEVLVHGGRIYKNGKGASDDTIAKTPEVFNPATGTFRPLAAANSATVYDAKKRGWYYPRSWLNSRSEVFFFKPNSSLFYTLDPKGQGRLKKVGRSQFGNFAHVYPAVRIDENRALTFRAGRVTTLIKFNNRNGRPSEKRVASIPNDRHWSDATVLADGTVAVSGGSQERQKLARAVYTVDLYNPSNNKWTTGARGKVARLYHSSAILLPSGAVLMAGGGPPGPTANLNAEMYYPPYLFDASGNWASRPTLDSLAGSYNRGATVRASFSGSSVSKVGLVRVGSATHSFDMGQMFFSNLKRSFRNGKLSVSLPKPATLVPPGYYMLFVFDQNGVPAQGQIFAIK